MAVGKGPGPDGTTLPAVRPDDALSVPIVVSNSLWRADDPAAYDGGRDSDITHLREFEASGLGRRDDARWAGPLVRLWEQMPEPKWCVALGDCTCSGGRYKRSYSTVEGIDRVMPVDV